VSYLKGPGAGESSGHKHWEKPSSNPLGMSINGTHGFANAHPAIKTYEGLKHKDEIAIYIRLAEKDYFPYKDDKYETLIYSVNIQQIITSLNEYGYYDAPGFRVRDEGRKSETVHVYFRFTRLDN
jgi:hypothetical protein